VQPQALHFRPVLQIASANSQANTTYMSNLGVIIFWRLLWGHSCYPLWHHLLRAQSLLSL
jgi:hypothetical protein